MIYKIGQPYIEINSQCNLSCIYCYHNEKCNQMLSVETLSDISKQIKLLGVTEIKISGGEPLLHPQFETIIRMLKHMGFRIELVTNGTLINDSNASFIASMIDKLVISLDSHNPNINNLTRPNSYKKVIEGIESLKRINRIHIYIGVVATNKNMDIEGFVKWAERNQIKGLIFESIHREGKAKSIFNDYVLEYSDYVMYRKQLLQIKDSSTIEISVLPDFGGGCMLIEDIPIIRPRIDYAGNVYLCRSFLSKEMSVGNIYRNKLETIFEGKATNKFISNLKERQNKISKCADCFIPHQICTGGCAAQAYNRTGNICETDDLCEWRIRNAFDTIKSLL